MITDDKGGKKLIGTLSSDIYGHWHTKCYFKPVGVDQLSMTNSKNNSKSDMLSAGRELARMWERSENAKRFVPYTPNIAKSVDDFDFDSFFKFEEDE